MGDPTRDAPIPSYSDSEGEHTGQAEEYEGVESKEGDSDNSAALESVW